MSLLSELKRRNVVRVGIVYCVTGWLIMQLADVVGDLLDLPAWTGKLVVMLLALGLPIALVFSWLYEVTPEGIQRTRDVDPTGSVAAQATRRIDRIIIVGLVLAIGVMLVDRYLTRERLAPADTVPVPSPTVASSAAKIRTIAVLPFANIGGDPANEFFSDGISEEILNTLASLDGLRVAARTSSFQYKGRAGDIAEIGRNLKVGALLEGSVRRQGNSVRISAQLIDVANGYQLWSRTFDRTIDDVFAVQSDIARQVAIALQLALGEQGSGAPPSPQRLLPTKNARAYELFLEGRHLARLRTTESVSRSLVLLSRAIEIDPEFAEAHSTLAYVSYASAQIANKGQAGRDLAKKEAVRARALDASLAEPLAVLGALAFDEAHWSETERLYRDALALSPDDPTARHFLARLYLATGYLDDFAREGQAAYALDPATVPVALLPIIEAQLKGDYATARRLSESLAAQGSLTVELAILPRLLYESGEREQALAVAKRAYERTGNSPRLAELVHEAMFEPRMRPAALAAIKAEPRPNYVIGRRLNDLIRIGEFDEAVHEALTAPDATPKDLLFIAWYRSTAPFRRSEVFQRYIREVGLDDYWRQRGAPTLCRASGERFECQ